MAGGFAKMNVTNSIKGLVSKKRIRYKQDGFDLDLAYITHNVIAMGYPASMIEGVFRNHIDDVVRFLEAKHKDHYYVYNLCSERSYDKSKFHDRVLDFPFDDHNPPRIELIEPFCTSVARWLDADPANVAAVHCKAGKGRTGTMICCYMMHAGVCPTAEAALSTYGSRRTRDDKGVTIPSQVRYVKYYETLLRNNKQYRPMLMNIREFQFHPAPTLAGGGQSGLLVRVSYTTNEGMSPQSRDSVFDLKKGATAQPLVIRLDYCLPLKGDVRVEFYVKSRTRPEKLFQFWFNTFFVSDRIGASANNGAAASSGYGAAPAGGSGGGGGGDDNNAGNNSDVVKCPVDDDDDLLYQLCLHKHQLDILSKTDKQNKQFSADFQLRMVLQQIRRGGADVRDEPTRFDDRPLEAAAAAAAAAAADSASDECDDADSSDDSDDGWDSESAQIA